MVTSCTADIMEETMPIDYLDSQVFQKPEAQTVAKAQKKLQNCITHLQVQKSVDTTRMVRQEPEQTRNCCQFPYEVSDVLADE